MGKKKSVKKVSSIAHHFTLSRIFSRVGGLVVLAEVTSLHMSTCDCIQNLLNGRKVRRSTIALSGTSLEDSSNTPLSRRKNNRL